MDIAWNEAQGRYEQDFGDGVVYARCRLKDSVLYIDYVEAPPALRGTGAAGKFMKNLLEQVRAYGRTVVPVCGYAAAWIARHPEYQDLKAS